MSSVSSGDVNTPSKDGSNSDVPMPDVLVKDGPPASDKKGPVDAAPVQTTPITTASALPKVWQMKEVQINKPPQSSKTSGNAGDAGDDEDEEDAPEQKSIYFWTLNKDVAIPPAKGPTLYACFNPDSQFDFQPPSSGGKRDIDDVSKNTPKFQGKLYFVPWNLFGQWRKFDTSKDPLSTTLAKNPFSWNREKTTAAKTATGGDAVDFNLQGFVQSKVADQVSYFDDRFAKSQTWAKNLDMKDYPAWIKVENVAWNQTTGGGITSAGDTRTFRNSTDGVGFTLASRMSIPVDGINENYVKLKNAKNGPQDGEAKILVTYDSGARSRGIDDDKMYISESRINLLRDTLKPYKWQDEEGPHTDISIRKGDGQPTYITVTAPNLQDSKFWQGAYDHGVSKPGGSVRSRNPKGLELLFVIPKTSRVTDTQLQALVQRAQDAAVIPINQTAKIVKEDAAAEEKKIYNRPLGTSPFGDYETWIKEKDYISYVQSYPGQPLPAIGDLSVLKAAYENLKKGLANAASNRNNTYNKAVEDQGKALSSGKALPSGIRIGRVSAITVSEASGTRASAPGQATQMGGSASTIAEALKWKDASNRIGSADIGTIAWDSPGVYPSEWLHRSAYSWGNEGNKYYSQGSGNFVFGSSEANSLMTRWEKSWQALFLKENSIRTAIESQPGASKLPPFAGLLTTSNTPEDEKIVDISVASDALVIKTLEKPGKDKTDAIDYWSWTTDPDLTNMSFTLKYSLDLPENQLGIPLGLMTKVFYPFQRGFFTRLEADMDMALLEQWSDNAKARITTKTPGLPGANTVPALNVPGTQSNSNISALPLLVKISDASSDKILTSGSPLVVSASQPSDLPHADVWRAVVDGQPIEAGGVQITNPSIVTMNDDGHLAKIPLATAVGPDADDGTAKLLVAQAPLTAPTLVVQGSQAPTEPTTIDTPRELAATGDDAIIPKGFVLSGSVKLFGKFDEQMYSFYGNASIGLRQIVMIKPGTMTISTYIPSLAGSAFEAIQLQNTQFVYNELTTPTNPAGLWLQTDVVFSGPLQPVSDVFKNVFHQENPALRLQGLLSAENNWAQPLEPPSFSLRASLNGLSIKFADLIEFTDVGLSLSVGRRMEMFPPYAYKYDWGVGFFGSLLIETPNDIAPMSLEFTLNEYAGSMALLMSVVETGTTANFCGVPGLKLSAITFSATFLVGSSPSQLALTASAALVLRDTSFDLDGYYTKGDWGFKCELGNFDIASLRNMYEDLFGSPLHISDHEILLDDLVLVAGSGGITIAGSVTIEGHTSAEATIAIGTLGVHITGSVEDVHLDGNIVLTQASLDIFIGRQDDTTLQGPGTSFRFSISGTVSVANNKISASLYLDKNAGNLVWTVYGSFTGAFSISRIAPDLKGTFLDLSLQQAVFIASNVDGMTATGAVIPAAYSVVKGVQIAASLGSIGALDSTLNRGTATTGMILKAIYSADTASFRLAIQLAAPQTISMKNSNVWSGPISLQILISTAPTLLLNADFFVRVQGQKDPLKFSGGVKMNIARADLFIELQDQWWINPFGLSPQLKLGPDLALQIGVVYAGPVYPSEIGIAAGLAVGSASGKAALSISEDPSDELIMMEIDNLGITDLVSFASTIFETSLPKPSDFLQFKQVKFYLSSGATIGTIVYPPGASFSCDAVIFGTEATIFCGVDKVQKMIKVKGTLKPVDIGPLSISGAQPGTDAILDVELGTSQLIFISGSIRLLDLYAMIDVHASFLPTPTFDLKTELDFSTHLKFTLEAHMANGSFKSLSALKNLDFDVHATFQQDILDYIVAQVNAQVVAAKHAIDDGIETANKTLDSAEKEFNDGVAAAQARVDTAKTAFDAKTAKVTGELAAEQRSSELRIKHLQQDLDAANATFNKALTSAKQNLTVAQENRTKAIKDAEQKVDDAKKNGDNDIDNHLKALAAARQDMQNRFGDAINNLNKAQSNVNNAQSAVDSAQRDLDSAKNDLAHCHWYEKVSKAAVVAAMGTKLEAVKAGLATANAGLSAARAIVQGPGYSAAQASINFYQTAVDTAKSAADKALSLANSTLQETINVQNSLVTQAENALTAVQTTGNELHLAQFAKKALDDFQAAEAKVLSGLQAAVNALAQSAEAIAFGAANTGLAFARANVKDIDIAKNAMEKAREAGEAALDMGNWLAKNTFNILNLKNVDVTGDLRGLCKQGTELKAHIVGTLAGNNVDFSCDFLPAQGEEFVKRVFERLLADVKSGVLKIL